ncbi:pyruvate formate lyase family protein [Thermophilibacter immobilis]|uniref:Pyruvate formate-lyase n=1 Tax=Thermophilibacter immobilis TaxID=2779519 RepID=A0A7S7M9E5_9ACTN|nr:pyruvate formate lyase family protein [Thermophilibacter immobilis]QOY60877.1 pyruvate formate-lyase [Thermophilibacter immobilis]
MKNDKQVAEIVEINKKVPCEKSVHQQIDIMQAYTDAHRVNSGASTVRREIECLKAIYPITFRHVEESDLVVGRTDVLPVGFGCVTSVGGVGHYCTFSKLNALRSQTDDPADLSRLDAIEAYWDDNDTRSIFYEEALTPDTFGKFVDGKYGAVVTARLSGTMLNYGMLVELGIPGLLEKIEASRAGHPESSEFYDVMGECVGLLAKVVRHHVGLCEEAKVGAGATRIAQLDRVEDALSNLLVRKPETLIEGIELCWLYTLIAGVVNYGRADVYLGELLSHDLDEGILTEDEGLQVIKSWFLLIDARHSNVNGRVIVGGKGRPNPQAADRFVRLAIEAVRQNRTVEPQLTLRCYEGMDDGIYQQALECIGTGCTYPMLLNDEAVIAQVRSALNVGEEAARNYVPFGCGELVIDHASVGTPNALVNVLKMLTISLNGGIDPFDGVDRSNGVALLPPSEMHSFEDVFNQYAALLEKYFDDCARLHWHSYEVMNDQCDFLLTSLLTDDCLDNGKAVLKGGVRFLGGTNETYGNINAADSLTAIKKVVFDDGAYTLDEVVKAAAANFEGYDGLRQALLDAPKYGNDDACADGMATRLHDFICKTVRSTGEAAGFHNYGTVLINNQVNTEWGRKTGASTDGRLSGMFMNNGNNPQSGADHNGPTAMLNSLLKLRLGDHAGSVQNIKFSKGMFATKMPVLRALFESYWRRGGSQLMVSVVDPGELEDALVHPELHENLLVRVGGFSARFVALEPDVQQEILARTLNE